LKFSKLSLRFLLAFLLVLTCAAQTQPAGPEGSRQGTLGAGSVKLRVVLTLTQTAPGEFKGVLDSLDQGATIPADKVTLTGDKLRVDFARVNGFYEGVVGKDGAEITGTWTQNNTAQPLSFKRAEASATAAPVTPKAAPPTDAKPSAPAKPFSSPVDVTVPVAPIAFHADGRIHLSYELHIANFAGSGISLEHIDVIDGSGTVLTAVDRSDLVSNILLPGNRQAVGMDKLNVGSGQLAGWGWSATGRLAVRRGGGPPGPGGRRARGRRAPLRLARPPRRSRRRRPGVPGPRRRLVVRRWDELRYLLDDRP